MNQFTNGEAAKFVAMVFTAIAGALPLYFAGARWEPMAVFVLIALVGYLVPNQPKKP